MNDTGICNLALSHLASSAELTSLTSDRSKEAKACQLVFETARGKVLRDFPWPFARRVTALALVTDLTSDSDSEWDYAYRYPGDAIAIRRIVNQWRQRVDIRATRVPFEVAGDSTGKLIMTDEASARCEWTFAETNPERFAPDFVIALSHYIAYLIAPRVTAGDQFKLGDRSYQHYLIELEKARINAINEGQDDDQPEADMILFRE